MNHNILRQRLCACTWLNDPIDSLCRELDEIEKWIDGHSSLPNPCKEKMLLAFERIKDCPRLVIIGQDPYPDSKATGIAFQTRSNVHSSSLDTLSKSLGICDGYYPNIGKWGDELGILMLNAALCNFGKCGEEEILCKWRKFIIEVVLKIRGQKSNVVVMLLGKEHVWDIFADDEYIIKCKHPAFGWGPTFEDWMKAQDLLGDEYLIRNFANNPVEINGREKSNI